MQKTGTIKAFLPNHSSLRPVDVHEADGTKLVGDLGFSNYDMTTEGWVEVGVATITVDLLPHREMTEKTIEALRKEQGELVAKSNALEARIQQLLAIEMSPA